MKDIINVISTSFGSNYYFYVFLGCLIICFVIGKEKRKNFAIPALLISIATLNPIVRKIMENADNGDVYWRALWMIPVIAVCAAVPSIILDKTKKLPLRIITIISALSIFIGLGTFIYNDRSTTFTEAYNPDKLPEEVTIAGDILLELDDEPRVVADSYFSTYLRQYNGRIKMPYGRSVTYGTPSMLGEEIHGYLTSQKYSELAQIMINHDYEYLIIDNFSDEMYEAIKEAGFEHLEQIDRYGVYRVHANRTEKREYNDKGQITHITYLDEEGNLQNNNFGYAEVKCEYVNGQLSLTNYLDTEGNEVDYGSGYFHRYLNELADLVKSRKIVVFVSIKDEGTYSLTTVLQEDLYNLGIKANLLGQFRKSYYAVIAADNVLEKKSDEVIQQSGNIGNHEYIIISGGNNTTGNISSVQIDGEEYSKNRRGINIVVYDLQKEQVTDSVTFDTFAPEMTITR